MSYYVYIYIALVYIYIYYTIQCIYIYIHIYIYILYLYNIYNNSMPHPFSPHSAGVSTRSFDQKCLKHPGSSRAAWVLGKLENGNGKSLLKVNNSMPRPFSPHSAGVSTGSFDQKCLKHPSSSKRQPHTHPFDTSLSAASWKKIGQTLEGICIRFRHCTCSNIHGKRAAPFVIWRFDAWGRLGMNCTAEISCT